MDTHRARFSGTAVAGIGILSLVVLGAFAWFLRSPGGQASGPVLPVGPAVPDFSLTRQDGVPIALDDLRGSICVMDFIFTRCAGPCPKLTARMRSLQLAMQDWPEPARLVSVTLDPDYDRPEVLRRYAKVFHIDLDTWWLLTGDDREQVQRLVREGFLQSVFPADENSPLIHSTHFIIIDRAGRIRASYDGMEPSSKPLILRDVRTLLTEPPSG